MPKLNSETINKIINECLEEIITVNGNDDIEKYILSEKESFQSASKYFSSAKTLKINYDSFIVSVKNKDNENDDRHEFPIKNNKEYKTFELILQMIKVSINDLIIKNCPKEIDILKFLSDVKELKKIILQKSILKEDYIEIIKKQKGLQSFGLTWIEFQDQIDLKCILPESCQELILSFYDIRNINENFINFKESFSLIETLSICSQFEDSYMYIYEIPFDSITQFIIENFMNLKSVKIYFLFDFKNLNEVQTRDLKSFNELYKFNCKIYFYSVSNSMSFKNQSQNDGFEEIDDCEYDSVKGIFSKTRKITAKLECKIFVCKKWPNFISDNFF